MLADFISGFSFDSSVVPTALVWMTAAVFIIAAVFLGRGSFGTSNDQANKRPRTNPALTLSNAAAKAPAKLSLERIKARDSWLLDEEDPEKQRQSLRREGHTVNVLVTRSDRADECISAVVTDRSRGGLKLIVTEPVPVATVLGVRALNAPDENMWVRLSVRRCEQVGDHWEIGCQFLEEQPWNILLLFG